MIVNAANICSAMRGVSAPVLSTEGHPGDLLARAEAVVRGTAGKTLLP